jgi:hypothetical protein
VLPEEGHASMWAKKTFTLSLRILTMGLGSHVAGDRRTGTAKTNKGAEGPAGHTKFKTKKKHPEAASVSGAGEGKQGAHPYWKESGKQRKESEENGAKLSPIRRCGGKPQAWHPNAGHGQWERVPP